MRGFCVAVALALSCHSATAFVWSDCANSSNTALTIHEFNLHPVPATLPGNVHVTLNLTVNRPIDHLFIDVELNKVSAVVGLIPVPCINGTGFGSCQNIDACSILSDVLNGSSVVSVDLGRQLEGILLSALGHEPQCPIKPESVFLDDEFHLKDVPQTLVQLADGDYHVKMTIKDTIDSTENVGCLEFDAGFKRRSQGFLFGGGN